MVIFQNDLVSLIQCYKMNDKEKKKERNKDRKKERKPTKKQQAKVLLLAALNLRKRNSLIAF